MKLANVPQRIDFHPEGNTLKHVITVTRRAILTNDVDIILSAIFHDIGKDDTLDFDVNGRPTAHGHEKISAKLVVKYRNLIKSLGGNPVVVFFIVKNHMRVKRLNEMRKSKQNRLKNHPHFSKLMKFTKIDRSGLDI
jgi:CRISPR/Cas system-associated endonuclease Cas3-HD